MTAYFTLALGPAGPTSGGEPHRSPLVFQLLLTLSLLAVGLYSVALRRKIPMLGNMAALVTMGALFLVWRPADATALAEWLGIGRGVDLILYCWVIISMMMILNLHLKMRIQSETVTELVRQLAIAQPFAVAGAEPGVALGAERGAEPGAAWVANSAAAEGSRPGAGSSPVVGTIGPADGDGR